MRRAAYQLLGLAVWKLAVQTLRRRFGVAPKKVAAGALVAAVVAGLLLALRRGGGDDG
jgi:hypothetical protein